MTNFFDEDIWTGLKEDGLLYAAVPWEDKESFLRLHESITGASIRNVVFLGIFQNCMEPYLYGEVSYDECVAELINKLNLYVSE